MSKKMSYVSAVDAVLNGEPCEGEIRERFEALRESLAKRSSSKAGKPSKTAIANAEIGESLVSAMEHGKLPDDIAHYQEEMEEWMLDYLDEESFLSDEIIKAIKVFNPHGLYFSRGQTIHDMWNK